jgi:NAD(P)-dependent dehydrogenase (short-subunit alcohol dehydrogenase family)
MQATFSGRRAMVTGGTGGIGRAIALALVSEGCDVTVTGLTPAEVEASRRSDEPLAAVPLDVTDQEAVNHLVGRFDRLDLLINAAGMLLRDGREFDLPDFLRVVDVNLAGTARMCLACRPLLERRGGSIVNLASMLSFFGSGSVPAYSASKGGVAQLTKSLAIAWADRGIRVNAIAPGWFPSDMSGYVLERHADTLQRHIPLGRFGGPEDLKGAVVFLASRASAYVTGHTLVVDGGESAW